MNIQSEDIGTCWCSDIQDKVIGHSLHIRGSEDVLIR